MGRLDGRVAIVTGAGRGLGRAHALFLAAHGATVIVNDLGADARGEGADPTPAQEVALEIEALGGRAVVSGHDIADWTQAHDLVQTAIDTFGDLHALVNNAGIVRDRMLANMSEDEWDAVIRVHLKGHAAPTRHAFAYWRDRAKTGHSVKASVVNTSSPAAFSGNFGQANYSAAKAGIIALSHVIALEGAKYGVRSNAISPSALTRLSLTVPGVDAAPSDTGDSTSFEPFDPANVSPIVGWLVEADCRASGQTFHVWGEHLKVISRPAVTHALRTKGRWTLEALDHELSGRLLDPAPIASYFAE